MLNSISSNPGFPLASRIACLSDPAPLSLVVATKYVAPFKRPIQTNNTKNTVVFIFSPFLTIFFNGLTGFDYDMKDQTNFLSTLTHQK